MEKATVGTVMKNLRRDQKMTQEEFGHHLGISQKAVWRIENNEQDPPFLASMKMRENFSLDMNYFFDSLEDREIF